jgi:hypothetical protein
MPHLERPSASTASTLKQPQKSLAQTDKLGQPAAVFALTDAIVQERCEVLSGRPLGLRDT